LLSGREAARLCVALERKALGLPMKHKPQLVADASVRGEAIVYRCSACAQILLLPKDRTPKDAAAELWAAFNEHVQEKHPEEAAGSHEHPVEDCHRKKGAGRTGAGDATPGEMGTRMLVEAAYRISEEVGQDLEAILKTGSSEEKLASLHAKIVKATRNRQSAEEAYAAILAALHPP
jgi:hypothetical protein